MARLWSVALCAALSGFERLDIDADAVCEQAGLDRDVLDDVNVRVPFDQGNAIWAAAAERFGRPGLGLWTGTRIGFGEYQVLDYLIATADTLEKGLRRVAGHFLVVTEGATRLRVEERSPNEPLRCVYGGSAPLDVRDYSIGLLLSRIRRFGGEVRRVELAGPPMAKRRLYADMWEAEVRFERGESTIVIPAASADTAIDPELLGLDDLIAREAKRLLADALGDDELGAIRATISRMLPDGKPRLWAVARQMHLGERTLQRRLSDLGWTFSELVDDTRAQIARRHLCEHHLSVAEIGYLVGFAEPSSFTRAFKRWFDCTPAQFRGDDDLQ